MGRRKKYMTKCEVITISVPAHVLELVELIARKIGKNRSECINLILEHFAVNHRDFCRLMARKAAMDLHYWKTLVETIDTNKAVNPEEYEDKLLNVSVDFTLVKP